MEAVPDSYEVALRTWVAEERIVRDVRLLTKRHGLDPVLVEDVEDAFRTSDKEAKDEALLAFLTALEVAIE